MTWSTIDMQGKSFGRLTVRSLAKKNARNQALWLCDCACGGSKIVLGIRLRSGKTTSCGCLAKQQTSMRFMTHGMSGTAEYRIYKGMVNRCHLPTAHAFDRYGGRGIKVCDRWRFGEGHASGFECFLKDMGRRPSMRHSLERKDNDGNYHPTNVKWGTDAEQANNSGRNRRINIGDCFVSMSTAHERFSSVSYSTLKRRLDAGWEHEQAVFTPPGKMPPPMIEAVPF
jgi:hypothetical protein